jgi:hypothetical protein
LQVDCLCLPQHVSPAKERQGFELLATFFEAPNRGVTPLNAAVPPLESCGLAVVQDPRDGIGEELSHANALPGSVSPLREDGGFVSHQPACCSLQHLKKQDSAMRKQEQVEKEVENLYYDKQYVEKILSWVCMENCADKARESLLVFLDFFKP